MDSPAPVRKPPTGTARTALRRILAATADRPRTGRRAPSPGRPPFAQNLRVGVVEVLHGGGAAVAGAEIDVLRSKGSVKVRRGASQTWRRRAWNTLRRRIAGRRESPHLLLAAVLEQQVEELAVRGVPVHVRVDEQAQLGEGLVDAALA